MPSEGEFVQQISADPTGFLAGWNKAVAAAKSGTEAMKGSLGGLASAFSSVSEPLIAIGALLAGGAFFKDAIDAANKLNDETLLMAKSLGVTGTQAATLSTALKDIGSDSDTYVTAFQKFARQLKTNEAGMNSLGLVTRDANGHLRDSNTLFTEALHSVSDYKPGLDQTTYAQTMFGRSVKDVMQLQLLTNEVMAEAKQRNSDLFLNISTEGVAASQAYRRAMSGVGDVFLGVKNVIGQAFIPIVTQLAEWFNAAGPAAVFIFKGAIGGLAAAFDSLLLGIKVIFNALRALVDPLVTFGGAIMKLFHGDITGATNDMIDMPAKWGKAWQTAFQNMTDDSVETQKKLLNLFLPGTEVSTGTGTNTMGDMGKKKAAKSQMPDWSAQLAEQKLAEEKLGQDAGQFREMSLADEAKFWRDKAALASASTADRQSALRKGAEAEMSAGKQTLTAKLATLQAEEAAFKNDTDMKLKFELQVQAMYVQGTKGFEDAQKKINEIRVQAAAQAKQIQDVRVQSERDAALQVIAIEEQTVKTQQQLGLITQAQVLAADQVFENKRNAIDKAALQERMEAALKDPDRNPVLVAQISAQLETLENQHQLKLKQIDQQAIVERQKYQTDFFNTLQSNMTTSFAGILNGTETLGTGMKKIWVGIGASLADTVAKMAADWLVGQLKMRVASKETSMLALNNDALTAAGKAYNAIVGIPFVGPFLAPAAAAVAYAGVMAFGAGISAEGGFDIPGNVNPIVQTHASEMVLPKKQADVIRGMANGGGGGGTVHIHTTGGDFVHKDNLAQLLTKMHRNFAFVR